MSVVDLSRRTTSNWDEFSHCVRSSDSLIYFEDTVPTVTDPPGSIDLLVGSRWFDPAQDRFFAVEQSGLNVKPQTCVVIEVGQRIALPHNIMGIVTGKGQFIFKSAMISTGKIDPGFDGRLRIGFYNASREIIVLTHSQPFCSCCFFNTESEARNPKRYEAEPVPSPQPIPRLILVRRFFAENWKVITPIVISIASFVVAILK